MSATLPTATGGRPGRKLGRVPVTAPPDERPLRTVGAWLSFTRYSTLIGRLRRLLRHGGDSPYLGCGPRRQRSQLQRKPYSHPLRLNATYKPPDSTMMSKLDQMNPLVLAKPG
jgi:hypothetical protein